MVIKEASTVDNWKNMVHTHSLYIYRQNLESNIAPSESFFKWLLISKILLWCWTGWRVSGLFPGRYCMIRSSLWMYSRGLLLSWPSSYPCSLLLHPVLTHLGGVTLVVYRARDCGKNPIGTRFEGQWGYVNFDLLGANCKVTFS